MNVEWCPNLLHAWLHLSGTVAAIILQPRKQNLRFIAEQIQIVLNFFVGFAFSLSHLQGLLMRNAKN